MNILKRILGYVVCVKCEKEFFTPGWFPKAFFAKEGICQECMKEVFEQLKKEEVII